MIYGFYNKHDKNREIIFREKFNSLAAAVKFFTQLKRLSPHQFSELYSVIAIEEEPSRGDGSN
jgi:hypothetical protein